MRYALKLLPFLALYVVYVALVHQDANQGDESRYLMFAHNLCHGFYSPREALNLWNGPGYPLVLALFVALKLPLLCVTLFNAVLHYATLLLFFETCRRFADARKSFIFTVVLGVYFFFWSEMPLVLTESLTVFLVAAVVWATLRLQERPSTRRVWVLGLLVGYLTLTKIIFGYALLLGLGVFAVLWLWKKTERPHWARAVVVLGVALLVNAPYLTYTYALTGRVLYWGNSGGMSLYWMSTPHANEFGEWNSWDFSTGAEYATLPEFEAAKVQYLTQNHGADYAQINALEGVARDDAFKQKALQNIRQHPAKYLKNVLSNVGRFFFNAPNSYTLQKDKVLRWGISSLHLALIVFSLIPTLLYWRRLPWWLRFLLIFSVLYVSLLALVSASVRMFNILLPVVYVWAAYVWTRVVELRVVELTEE